MNVIRILAISGSLRAASSNTHLLEAAQSLAPERMELRLYEGLSRLPHFNPDLDGEAPPPEVLDLRRRIAEAHGLLICSPEYARGVPGSLKNALDWLVSCSAFPDKPVALFNASQRSTHAQESLRLTLQTMSARLIDSACITVALLGTKLDAPGIASDVTFGPQVRAALVRFAEAITSS
jgi:chromate reductase, NAD(P)H dehydrogenase (quinone)